LLTDAGLQKLKPGEKLDKRGDRDGMSIAVLPSTGASRFVKVDHTIKVVH
jgi:hypothetical protein